MSLPYDGHARFLWKITTWVTGKCTEYYRHKTGAWWNRHYVTRSHYVSRAYNADQCNIENMYDSKSFQMQSKYALQLHISLVMRKPAFCICQRKTQISFVVTTKLISAFVFATWIVQSLFFLNPKFHASSCILWLCSPVCVGPGQKTRRPVFSQ